ncbi:hypothetical protein [Parafrankia sp. EUN1f]|uniref:hypothetical protein n=1 Tax=Parafrankia sp. EUN1f TaxID=102897 RepID=UPI0001C452F5|nr:hypothetical protein [Parafrankia sp. EUN1f]EFC78996.1 hypothetical protein FrEUN1fDRAFT_7878 [Parafrankia sp. EUN1f]EFC80090.1 hypothetical protein FrEUN1fDRAFT_6817 [Parafrankia sp. EUN1f]
MTAPAPASPSCRVCGCTADDPCPTGRQSDVSCLPVPDPQGSPRLCHWCSGREDGATRCDVLATGLLAGPEPVQCAMGATHAAHFRCTHDHDRRINVCRMHENGAHGIPSGCAACPHEDEVPVQLVSSSPLHPTTTEEV